MDQRTYYLIYLQFLGFRYSGWQRQPGQKTIEGMLRKTLKFVLGDRPFKILGAGRTDAKVSALESAFELFLEEGPLEDTGAFLESFNANLPPDIRALRIREVDGDFNIIHHCRQKEYCYFFAFGQKLHPFCAPFMAGIPDQLDIELMKETAPLFEGTHDFRAYTAKVNGQKQYRRTVTSCSIAENTVLQANFFPATSFMLRISGQGFMRYQVRMIMGALIELGRGNLSADALRESLNPDTDRTLTYVAPGSGLVLNRVLFS